MKNGTFTNLKSTFMEKIKFAKNDKDFDVKTNRFFKVKFHEKIILNQNNCIM